MHILSPLVGGMFVVVFSALIFSLTHIFSRSWWFLLYCLSFSCCCGFGFVAFFPFCVAGVCFVFSARCWCVCVVFLLLFLVCLCCVCGHPFKAFLAAVILLASSFVSWPGVGRKVSPYVPSNVRCSISLVCVDSSHPVRALSCIFWNTASVPVALCNLTLCLLSLYL